MPGRRIRDEADARACLSAAGASGLPRSEWARRHGVDGRSLNAWRLNLERGAIAAPAEPVRLVELVVSGSPAPTSGQYVLRVGEVAIEVDDSFDAGTLHRLLDVVLSC